MFHDLPSYSESRTTPLPWVASLPSHWGIKRAKSLMKTIDVRSVSGEEELLTVSSKHGVVPRTSTSVSMFKAESYVGHKLCWPNDLVINSLWAWGRGLGVARHHGIVSTAYGVYRQRNAELKPSYLHELVRSGPFQWELQVRSQGVWKSRLQISDERWFDAPLLVPPPEEQAAIVKYLVHANARIDRAIGAKRRLISLLEEQKVSIVRAELERITTGQLVPLKRALRSITAGVWGSAPEESDDPLRWCVRVADFDYVHARIDTSTKTMRAISDAEFSKKRLKRGDLLLEGSGGGEKTSVARVVVYDVDAQAVCSNFLHRLRPAENVNSDFLAMVLRSLHATGAVKPYVKQTTGIQNLDLGAYFAMRIPLPPMNVQTELVAETGQLVADSNDAISRTSHEISLLQEFRTRLVADVVTGQVDVRLIAATLPEVPEMVDNQTTAIDDDLEEVLSEIEE